jgi:hypothetical protein
MTTSKNSAKPDNKWHDGPPPFAGWWNASRTKTTTSWRWWNGKNWGDYTPDHADAEEAAERANVPAYETDDPDKQIKWRWTYPKKARVQRHPPAKLKIVVNNTKKSKAKSKKVA